MKPTVLMFILGAALSWGVYVPLVHDAAMKMSSNLRAFLMVGIAYFLVAVIVPCVFIFITGDPTQKAAPPNFAPKNMSWGLAAGIAGAAGALCVIFAVTIAGKGGALYVAPLVFAGAPIINTIASMTVFSHGKLEKPGPLFYLGLLLAAGGAALVMLNKPAPAAAAQPPSAAAATDSGEGASSPENTSQPS